MPRGKKFTAEQIIGKLRESEVELARGKTVPEVVRKLGVTEQTFYRRERECLAIDVSRKLTIADVLERLSDLLVRWGVPNHIRSDNGSVYREACPAAVRAFPPPRI